MKIFCIGRNYVDHAKELNNPVPSEPLIFMKPSTALLVNNKPFYYPDFTQDLHYEGEIVLRIAKNGRSVQPEFASRYYDAVGFGIDFTARDVQDKLKSEAAKARGRDAAGSSFRSLLTGKLFDETGDRLTPSHGKTRNGIRHRYYVSHRLIAQSGEKDVTGWRLNAQMLEDLTVRIAVRYLGAATVPAAAIMDATANELIATRGRSAARIGDDIPSDLRARSVADLIARIDLARGQIAVAFAQAAISDLLNVAEDRVNPDSLKATTSVTMRRRGVETRLILGNEAQPPDRRLIANIATALSWLDRIKAGKTYAEIAQEYGVPKYRVQQAICYAFLAPDIIRQLLLGRQPVGLTSKWVFRHPLPLDWAEQRALIARL